MTEDLTVRPGQTVNSVLFKDYCIKMGRKVHLGRLKFLENHCQQKMSMIHRLLRVHCIYRET